MCCLDIWQKQEGLELESPFLPDSAPGDKVLQLNKSPQQRDQAQFLIIRVEGSSSLPAYRIIQTSQLYPPTGTRGTSPSWYYKACLPQLLVVQSVPECNPYVALKDMQCPPLGCECVWLLSYLSGVRYCVSGYSPNPTWQSLPHQWNA